MGDTYTKTDGEEIEVENGRKVNISLIEEVLHQVLRDNAEKWYKSQCNKRRPVFTYTISTTEVQTQLYKKHNMDVSTETIRRNGFSKGGVLENSYDYFEYNKTGDPKFWGMEMNFKEWLKAHDRLKDLKEKHKETEDSQDRVPEGYKGVEGYDY